MYEIEHFFPCPHCGAEISMLLDPSAGEQAYVEDCEVCCRPIHVHFGADGEAIAWFEANPVEQ